MAAFHGIPVSRPFSDFTAERNPDRTPRSLSAGGQFPLLRNAHKHTLSQQWLAAIGRPRRASQIAGGKVTWLLRFKLSSFRSHLWDCGWPILGVNL